MKIKSDNIVGWTGMILILLAYILLNFKVIDTESMIYLSFNVIGSCGIIVHSLKRKDYQPVILNVIWALVALFILISLLI